MKTEKMIREYLEDLIANAKIASVHKAYDLVIKYKTQIEALEWVLEE